MFFINYQKWRRPLTALTLLLGSLGTTACGTEAEMNPELATVQEQDSYSLEGRDARLYSLVRSAVPTLNEFTLLKINPRRLHRQLRRNRPVKLPFVSQEDPNRAIGLKVSLKPFSMIDPDAQGYVLSKTDQRDSAEPVSLGTSKDYRGHIRGSRGGLAAFNLSKEGLIGSMALPNPVRGASGWSFIEPLGNLLRENGASERAIRAVLRRYNHVAYNSVGVEAYMPLHGDLTDNEERSDDPEAPEIDLPNITPGSGLAPGFATPSRNARSFRSSDSADSAGSEDSADTAGSEDSADGAGSRDSASSEDSSDTAGGTHHENVNIYLMADVDYYKNQGSAHNVFRSQRWSLLGVHLITSFAEPSMFGNREFDIDFRIVGQATWVLGGPSSTNSATLLEQSYNQFPWYIVPTPINDIGLIHMFTGKDVDGSVIGRAWKIGGFDDPCGTNYATSFACKQSMAQPNFTGSNYYMKVILMAHELGHNMDALHSDHDPSYSAGPWSGPSIMQPFISGGQLPFYSPTNAEAIADKVAAECQWDPC